jgi:hypothetical protein
VISGPLIGRPKTAGYSAHDVFPYRLWTPDLLAMWATISAEVQTMTSNFKVLSASDSNDCDSCMRTWQRWPQREVSSHSTLGNRVKGPNDRAPAAACVTPAHQDLALNTLPTIADSSPATYGCRLKPAGAGRLLTITTSQEQRPMIVTSRSHECTLVLAAGGVSE